MFRSRQLPSLICALLCTALSSAAPTKSAEELQNALSRTIRPAERVQLLLSLKDLNEDTGYNLPYSIQLFREAAAIGDTYAMSVAVIPVITRYAPYPEQEDSLRYYVRTLRARTPGTPEEGMDCYAEMLIGFHRLRNYRTAEQGIALARSAVAWCDSLAGTDESIYRRTERLLLRGYARQVLDRHERGIRASFAPQAPCWEEAYALTQRMPSLEVRKNFANIVFFALSGSYYQARRYEDQQRLSADYIALLDAYYADLRHSGRRPCLYADNSYVGPYWQLLRGAVSVRRLDLADRAFEEFRRRMLAASGENLLRNRTYLYELGSQWKRLARDYEQSIRYSDSLIDLIERDKGYFRRMPEKIYEAFFDRSQVLTRAGRYDEAFDSYARTACIQDTMFRAERRERTEALRRRQELDRLRLEETRSIIRNRTAAILCFTALGLLLLGTGGYLFHTWLGNRRLQRDILRHSRKAQESDRMKSIFVNSICRGIGPPLDEIDRSANALMRTAGDAPERTAFLESIRHATRMLLSTLDNMLEAANLDSLTERLRLEPVDVDEVCRNELLLAERLRENPQVSYRIESPGTPCIVRTHPKYFAFVLRALLDNAGKATREGSVTLRYETDDEQGWLCIWVTDTGCGIPAERRESIFRNPHGEGPASQGLSLPLCRLIALHLAGSIRLDDGYTAGARFLFTIPLQP